MELFYDDSKPKLQKLLADHVVMRNKTLPYECWDACVTLYELITRYELDKEDQSAVMNYLKAQGVRFATTQSLSRYRAINIIPVEAVVRQISCPPYQLDITL